MITHRERRSRLKQQGKEHHDERKKDAATKRAVRALFLDGIAHAQPWEHTAEGEDEQPPSTVPEWAEALGRSHQLYLVGGAAVCRQCGGTFLGTKQSMLHKPCRHRMPKGTAALAKGLIKGSFPYRWKAIGKTVWPDGRGAREQRRAWRLCRCVQGGGRQHVSTADCVQRSGEEEELLLGCAASFLVALCRTS